MKKFLILALLSFTSAYAEEPVSESTFKKNACAPDLKQFCSDTNPGEILKCLVGNERKLSQGCKDDLQRFVQSVKADRERGGGAMSSFGGGNALAAPPVPLIIYDGRFISGDGASAVNENRLSISAPVSRSATDTYGVSLSGSRYHFGDTPTLSNGEKLSQNWRRSEVGFQYFHSMPGMKNWGGRVSLGYAGDDFTGKDVSFSATVNYGYPGSGGGYWVLLAFLSNNGGIANGIPIPGFIYIHKTATFTGMFGFPVLSMQWTPVSKLSLSTSLFGPNLTSEVAYGSIDTYQIFASHQWVAQNYIPKNRVNDKDRLMIEEQKAVIGFRTPVFSMFALELQGGRSFGRRLKIGESVLKAEGGKARLEAGFYSSASLRATF